MEKGFLETSALNRALSLGMDATALTDYLHDNGLDPACGLHVVYELARTFSGTPEKGKRLFQLLLNLDPTMQPPTDDLLRQELIKLHTGSAVLPFLDHDFHIATKEEITRLSLGIFGEHANEFIESKEAEFRDGYPEWAQRVIRQATQSIDSVVKPHKKIRTADDVYRHFQGTGEDADLIRQAFKDQGDTISALDAKRLAESIADYPAVRSLVMANCYLTSICISQQVVPGADRVFDFRHVIDASYCDSLITFDKGLANAAPTINPDLGVFWFDP